MLSPLKCVTYHAEVLLSAVELDERPKLEDDSSELELSELELSVSTPMIPI